MHEFAAYGLTGFAAIAALVLVTALRSLVGSAVRRFFRR